MSLFRNLADAFIEQESLGQKRQVFQTAQATQREKALVDQAIGNLRRGDTAGAVSLVAPIARERSTITGTPLVGPAFSAGQGPDGKPSYDENTRQNLSRWLVPTAPEQKIVDGWAIGMNPLGEVERQRALPEKPNEVITTDANGNTVVRYLPEAAVGQEYTFGGQGQPASPPQSGAPQQPAPQVRDLSGLSSALLGRQFPVTSNFGNRTAPTAGASTNHQAIDFGVPTNQPLHSNINGTVTWVGRKGGYGLTVEMRDAYGYTHRFAHLSSANVKPGQQIGPGKIFALTGGTRGNPNSGTSTGPHLHYQILRGTQSIHPDSYYKALAGRSAQQAQPAQQNFGPATRVTINGRSVVAPATQPHQGAENYFFVDPQTGKVTETNIETPASQSSQARLEAARLQAQARMHADTLRTQGMDARSATGQFNKLSSQIAAYEKSLYERAGLSDMAVSMRYHNNPEFKAQVDANVKAELGRFAEQMMSASSSMGELDPAVAANLRAAFGLPQPAGTGAPTNPGVQPTQPVPAAPAVPTPTPSAAPGGWELLNRSGDPAQGPVVLPSPSSTSAPVAPTPEPTRTPMATPRVAPAAQKLQDVLATPSPLLRRPPQAPTPRAQPSASPSESQEQRPTTLRELQREGQGTQRRPARPQARELGLRDYQRLGQGNQERPRR